jgi:hypothetical protein
MNIKRWADFTVIVLYLYVCLFVCLSHFASFFPSKFLLCISLAYSLVSEYLLFFSSSWLEGKRSLAYVHIHVPRNFKRSSNDRWHVVDIERTRETNSWKYSNWPVIRDKQGIPAVQHELLLYLLYLVTLYEDDMWPFACNVWSRS